jgi:voltage-gated potassium channel Kch
LPEGIHSVAFIITIDEHPAEVVLAAQMNSPDLHTKHDGLGFVEPLLSVGQLSIVVEHTAGTHFESSGI